MVCGKVKLSYTSISVRQFVKLLIPFGWRFWKDIWWWFTQYTNIFILSLDL